MIRRCVICGASYIPGRSDTCSDSCHEELIRRTIIIAGEYKKIVRMSTGVVYRVPTRDILEFGINEQDLDKYPVWVDEKE